MIKILFFGDIVGKCGRKAIAKILPDLKIKYQPDFIMANGENLAHGIGITTKTLQQCQQAGIDLFTSGNHVWKKPDVINIFNDPDAPLIRPANEIGDKPGTGYKTVIIGTRPFLVVSLNGQVFIEEKFSNPFLAIDKILQEHKSSSLAGIIVDFHAEATSEKVAFGWYADGRVSAVLGTHTHIPTADGKILPGGTAYITDVGMVGCRDSVIGVDKDVIINNFTNNQTKPHSIPEKGTCTVNAVLITIDPATKKAKQIKRIDKEIDV